MHSYIIFEIDSFFNFLKIGLEWSVSEVVFIVSIVSKSDVLGGVLTEILNGVLSDVLNDADIRIEWKLSGYLFLIRRIRLAWTEINRENPETFKKCWIDRIFN